MSKLIFPNKFKNLIRSGTAALVCLAALFVSLTSVQAISGYYETYNVTVELQKDSSFIVTEDVTTRWNGEFHYITRGIPLNDFKAQGLCRESNTVQCGGFSYIRWLELRDENGNKVPDSQYTFSKNSDADTEEVLLKWTFSQGGRNFEDETFHYTLKYQVFGGLGFLDAYDLFYWDMTPSDIPGEIRSSTQRIVLPPEMAYTFSEADTRVPNDLYGAIPFTQSYDAGTKTLTFQTEQINPGQNFTVLWQLPKGFFIPPAKLLLDLSPKPMDVELDGVLINGVTDELPGITAGKHKLKFKAASLDGFKYESYTTEVELAEGEVKTLKVQLKQAPIWAILEAINVMCGVLGCLLLPGGLIYLLVNWNRKGRDVGRRSTIYPQYTPPKDMRPYLLGSLKDETVDLVDLSATLIDLAYRGYIKIKEFKTGGILGIGGSYDYEFTKRKEDVTGLTEFEQDYLKAIFGAKTVVTMSKDLKEKFYTNITGLENTIYTQLKEDKYFADRPDKTRSKYYTWGGVMLFLGVGMFFVLGGLSFIILVILTAGLSLIALGIATLIVAKYMPAKTRLGSEALEHIFGFKMYLETAERFRLQNLTPEMFEKYLSYAVVFGIEEKWAAKFKDVYKTKPDWYETDRTGMWNAYMLSNALRNFSTTTVTALTTTPYKSSSGGWSSTGYSGGGGWSGGGGFSGGFSGGGGGGGSSGWG